MAGQSANPKNRITPIARFSNYALPTSAEIVLEPIEKSKKTPGRFFTLPADFTLFGKKTKKIASHAG
jgi:hypothetical protein